MLYVGVEHFILAYLACTVYTQRQSPFIGSPHFTRLVVINIVDPSIELLWTKVDNPPWGIIYLVLKFHRKSYPVFKFQNKKLNQKLVVKIKMFPILVLCKLSN